MLNYLFRFLFQKIFECRMLEQFFNGLQMSLKFVKAAKQKAQLIGRPFKMGRRGELGMRAQGKALHQFVPSPGGAGEVGKSALAQVCCQHSVLLGRVCITGCR